MADQAHFVKRDRCISCRSPSLCILNKGKFGENPIRDLIEKDPWGTSPMPFIEESPWEYLQCKNCGQTFHRYVLSPEWQSIRFTEWMTKAAIEEFERKHSPNKFASMYQKSVSFAAHISRIELLTRSIRQNDCLRVLDFGCGSGKFLSMASQYGFSAVGIDLDADRREISAQQGVKVYTNFKDLDFHFHQNFHIITLFQVLEHLDDPLSVLEECRKRLSSKGILIVETPNTEGVTGIFSEADYRAIDGLDHVNGFTPTSLKNLVEAVGFKKIQTPVTFMTSEFLRAVRKQAKFFLISLLPSKTEIYFRRSS